ncbi:hypothetical protein Tco_1115174 [Tanacetum coccineum]
MGRLRNCRGVRWFLGTTAAKGAVGLCRGLLGLAAKAGVRAFECVDTEIKDLVAAYYDADDPLKLFVAGADLECQLQQWCDGGGDPYTLLKTKDAVVAIKREHPGEIGLILPQLLDVEVDDPGAWAGCEQASSTFKSSNIHLPEFIAKVHELSVDPNLHGQ